MKRTTLFVALLLVVALAAGLFVGCGQQNGNNAADSQNSTAQDSQDKSSLTEDKSKEAESKEEKGFSGTYNFGGSTTVLPIAEAAIEAFEKLHPDVKISYDGTGSSVGVKGALEGTYHLGGASRELKDSEKEKGAVATPIANDGIAVIVNNSVSVDNLTLEQVAKIFSGEYKNWKDVGGQDKPIVVINRDEASGTRAAFFEMVLEKALGKDPEPKFIADAVTVESNGDMVTKVGATPDSIGYCGFGYLDKAKDAGAKAILVDGVEAKVEAVLDGTFPISRKLNIVSKGELKEGTLEKAFVDFLLSDEGQQIVEDTGFIKLK